jgi:SAM-dependent methyltransferase
MLKSSTGESFPIRAGVPSFTEGTPSGRGSVWGRFSEHNLERNRAANLGLPSVEALKSLYQSKQLILEIGSRFGRSTRFLAKAAPTARVFALDSSGTGDVFETTKDLPRCHVIRASPRKLPFASGFFDLIIAEHLVVEDAWDAPQAMAAIIDKLRPGGQMYFDFSSMLGPTGTPLERYIRERAQEEVCRSLVAQNVRLDPSSRSRTGVFLSKE